MGEKRKGRQKAAVVEKQSVCSCVFSDRGEEDKVDGGRRWAAVRCTGYVWLTGVTAVSPMAQTKGWRAGDGGVAAAARQESK